MRFLCKGFTGAIVAAMSITMFGAGSECPKTAASLPFHLIARSQIIVQVTVNYSGPYDFLLDTGAQITTLDPKLVTRLGLISEGSTSVVSVGAKRKVLFSRLASIQAGPHQVTDMPVVILELTQLQAVNSNIRGILGADFLKHFDTLIDYKHHVACLAAAGLMRPEVKGIRFDVSPATDQVQGPGTTDLLAIPIRLAGETGTRRVLLDSGTNVPFLYRSLREEEVRQVTNVRDANGAQAVFDTLAPQSIQIGSVTYHEVSFARLQGRSAEAESLGIDGLLPTAMFRRLYVSYKEHFVVLEPW